MPRCVRRKARLPALMLEKSCMSSAMPSLRLPVASAPTSMQPPFHVCTPMSAQSRLTQLPRPWLMFHCPSVMASTCHVRRGGSAAAESASVACAARRVGRSAKARHEAAILCGSRLACRLLINMSIIFCVCPFEACLILQGRCKWPLWREP